MGQLDEPALERLIAGACTGCGGRRLNFRAYVDAQWPLVDGEPVGALTWAYDGEKFIDGVFEVQCADCSHVLFAHPDCPRCHAQGALEATLASLNSWPPPRSCAACGSEEIRYSGMVPARVVYQGVRADKARTTTEMHEPGFHGFRVACVECGVIDELTERCALCHAAGPLRPRP